MEYARGAERLDFRSAIREGRSRLEGLDRLDPAWRVFSYVERGFYAGQLERLHAHFAPERCLLLMFEEMIADMDGTLARIAAFLGIDPFLPVKALIANAAPTMDYPEKGVEDDLAFLRDIYAADISRFGLLSGLEVGHWQV